MLKVKHERDCDCVVAGFRWHKKGDRTLVGSLLLGLFDDAGGVAACRRLRQLHAPRSGGNWRNFSAPYRKNALDAHPGRHGRSRASRRWRSCKRMPGGQSRWSQGKDLSWEPLRPELVVEVAYDHMQGNRFRHTAQFRRWRPTKSPATAPMPSSKSFRRRSWLRFFRQAAKPGLAVYTSSVAASSCAIAAIPAWDHHRGREFPARAHSSGT